MLRKIIVLGRAKIVTTYPKELYQNMYFYASVNLLMWVTDLVKVLIILNGKNLVTGKQDQIRTNCIMIVLGVWWCPDTNLYANWVSLNICGDLYYCTLFDYRTGLEVSWNPVAYTMFITVGIYIIIIIYTLFSNVSSRKYYF